MEPGLFVKEFTLFYDDRLTWFVTEEDEEGEHATPDHSFVEGGEEPLVTGTKYASIYEMPVPCPSNDMPELRQAVWDLREKEISGGNHVFVKID